VSQEQFHSLNRELLRVHAGRRSAEAMQRVGKAAAKVVIVAHLLLVVDDHVVKLLAARVGPF
jgi:hypothetical protein